MEKTKATQEIEISDVEKGADVPKIRKNVAAAQKYAEQAVLKTEDDHQDAIKALTKIGEERKRIDAQRKWWVDPLNERVKRINAMFRPFIDGLESAEVLLRRKLVEYQNFLAKKSEEAKAAVMKKVEKGTMKVETAVAKIEKVKEPEKTVRTEEATVTYREVKKVVIEDALKLPREYLIPDEVKIRKVALAGVVIPGVKVVVEKIPSVKSNT